LAIKILLVSVSGWNSWLKPFRFHVNYFQFRAAVFVHVGPAQLCKENWCLFYVRSAVEVAYLTQNILPLAVRSHLTIFTSLCWVR